MPNSSLTEVSALVAEPYPPPGESTFPHLTSTLSSNLANDAVDISSLQCGDSHCMTRLALGRTALILTSPDQPFRITRRVSSWSEFIVSGWSILKVVVLRPQNFQVAPSHMQLIRFLTDSGRMLAKSS